MKTIMATGYFDPLHVGHIEYLEKAKSLGDKLIVVVNSDKQALLKKGFSFMVQEDRMRIISSLKMVDQVVLSIDEDKSQCETIRMIKPNVFANGGDRNQGNIPEFKVCEELGIEMIDGLGEKIRSSSEMVSRSNNILNRK